MRASTSRALNPPAYPADVLKEGVAGMVVLVVEVAPDGSVSAARIDRSAGDQRLDAAALDAVKRWKFTPAREDGKPVASQVRVPVEFRLDETPTDAPVKTANHTLPIGRTQAPAWNTYEQLVGSLDTSWHKPPAVVDKC